ncbi:ribonuclease H-like domain-containing protein [Tanacetum coccineum]
MSPRGDKFHNVPNAKSLYAAIKSRYKYTNAKFSTASGNFRVNTAEELVQQVRFHLLQMTLERIGYRWQVVMLTVRSAEITAEDRRGTFGFKGKQLVTFNKSNVECYNCHRKGHFAKECKSGRNQGKRFCDNGRRNATTNNHHYKHLVAQRLSRGKRI